MNEKTLTKKIKASVRAHYVKKKDYDKLKDRVRKLEKTLASLQDPKPATAQEKPVEKAKAGGKSASPQTTGVEHDNLKRIKGIGPVIAGKLIDMGVTRFAQIAAWTQEDIDRVSSHLDFKGRIEREEWVKQAGELTG